MVVTTREVEQGDLCWVKGGCRWGRKEELMPGQRCEEPLRALGSGGTECDAVLGYMVLFNGRTARVPHYSYNQRGCSGWSLWETAGRKTASWRIRE